MLTGYVIRNNDNGKLHSDPHANPTGHSYTTDLRCAKRYPNSDAAHADKCGNETVVPLEHLLQSF